MAARCDTLSFYVLKFLFVYLSSCVLYTFPHVSLLPCAGIIPPMEQPVRFKSVGLSSLFLMLLGWGGLYYLINYTFPYVWPRWAFFVLTLMAVTGTALPIVYLFHRRFPGEKPAEGNVIVRQALWFGIYAATLAWLQLGRLVTLYVIIGLAAGLFAIEYLIRLREKAHWKPPIPSDDQPS